MATVAADVDLCGVSACSEATSHRSHAVWFQADAEPRIHSSRVLERNRVLAGRFAGGGVSFAIAGFRGGTEISAELAAHRDAAWGCGTRQVVADPDKVGQPRSAVAVTET